MMTSQWKGSELTASHVQEEIEKRFGEEAAEDYDPETNCFTYRGWLQRGYQVKKGQKGIRSITFIPIKDKETDKVVRVFKKTIVLFFVKQVEKVK